MIRSTPPRAAPRGELNQRRRVCQRPEAVKTIEMIERINQPHLDHGLERGLGIEL
jgi:hypothetical protein